MTMISKIADRHLSRQACIYVRQSTPAQVRSNQESTDRQYNLLNKARSLGWKAEQIRVLDRDLGQSGAAAAKRADFKALVGDVAMGQIGAIFALEASRLARSNQDWHRLLELCAITGTLVIDEDGCYDPAEFNDSLVLGMKGTFAQAELHIPRSRHDPKVLGRDDAEVVGNRIAEVRPIARNLFAQETERRVGEVRTSCVAFVVRNVSMHQAP